MDKNKAWAVLLSQLADKLTKAKQEYKDACSEFLVDGDPAKGPKKQNNLALLHKKWIDSMSKMGAVVRELESAELAQRMGMDPLIYKLSKV